MAALNPDPQDRLVKTTRQFLEVGEPILFVSHDLVSRDLKSHEVQEPTWQFRCQAGPIAPQDLLVVPLQQLIDRDSSLQQLNSLPSGWTAERKDQHSHWILRKSLQH